MNGAQAESVWLTSIAFSSSRGNRDILAAGRSDGTLILTSIQERIPRFEVEQPYSITCLSWRPCCTPRPSRNPMSPGTTVQTEDLVVGDETGTLYYFAVEWPLSWEVSRSTWPGSMALVAKLSLHSQQICGLAWSPCGQLLASGGNDNLCYLVEVNKILGQNHQAPDMGSHHGSLGERRGCVTNSLQHDARVPRLTNEPTTERGGGSDDPDDPSQHPNSGPRLRDAALGPQGCSQGHRLLPLAR